MSRPDFSFPREYRLITAHQYRDVFATKKKRVIAHFALHFRKNDLAFGRLGMVTKKERVKTAVQRNLIRRITRETFRLHQSELAGLDVVVVALRGADVLAGEMIHEELTSLLRRQIPPIP